MELKNLGQTAASALIHTDIPLEREHWTMFRNKTSGIAAAATLGLAAMLGSTAAHAVVDLDATAAAKANPAVTFARETLTTKVATDSMYYVVNGGADGLDVTVALGAAGGGNDANNLSFTFELEGAVFSTPLTTDSLVATGLEDILMTSGGQRNDTMVVYTASRGTGATSTVATLNITDIGIMTNGSASVEVTIVNREQQDLLGGTGGTKTASYPGAVAIASGVKPDAMPNTLTTYVARSYRDFGMTAGTPPAAILSGTLGNFMVGLTAAAAPFQLNASDGSTVEDLSILVADTGTAANTVGSDSSVTIMGDFSFVSNAWLEPTTATPPCEFTDGTDVDLRIKDPDDATKVTDTTMLRAQSLGFVNTNPQLCISVPAHTETRPVSIPRTGAYMAMVAHKAGSAGGMMLPADASHDLGRVRRDGTTVRLPYLSTNAKFNQRIRMVNRSATEARYEMEFHGDGDMAGMDASGMLAPNSITVLSLRTDDVVMPGNGNSTSGTLIVEVQRGTVDVASVQVNRETGNTDTVVYMAEMQ